MSQVETPDLGVIAVKDIDKRLESQIQDILEASDVTEEFIADMTFPDFSQDQKTIFAVERSLGIVGATAKRLPISFQDNYPDIPWRDIIGIGDKLTYGYFETDIAVLWEVAKQHLPLLKTRMHEALARLNDFNK